MGKSLAAQEMEGDSLEVSLKSGCYTEKDVLQTLWDEEWTPGTRSSCWGHKCEFSLHIRFVRGWDRSQLSN